MKPPICIFCGLDFRDSIKEGGLLSFSKDPAHKAHQEALEKEGMTGHPKHLGWFCGTHLEQAKKFQDLKLKEALIEMRKMHDKSTKSPKE